VKSTLSLCFFLATTLLVRCYNFASIFVGGQIYFVDADCYSRMTRVRMVMAHPFTIIRHHDFENYPQGIVSHATAPFDYLIAGLAVLLKPFTENYLDLAGAIVSPLMGAFIVVFLWIWVKRAQLPYGGMVLFFSAVSPILVHGTILGRPDHQSLQMLCIAVALGAEWCFSRKPSRGWGIVSGVAWGLGLWTSLYEPAILLVATVLLYAAFDRRKLWVPERKAGYLWLAGIGAVALIIQGVPFSVPGQTLLEYFPRWERTIGEMSSTTLLAPLLYHWVGLGLIAMPVLFLCGFRADKRAIPIMLLVLLTCGLTLWQIRWGYFFALVFAMSLPIQFVIFRKPWIAWTMFAVCLWPLLKEWDEDLYPNDERSAQLHEEWVDEILLRDAAEHLKSTEKLPLLAPWWFSPALAYWSGQPAVAGSSHEGMAGIVDTARFYLTNDPEEGRRILQAHGVKRVIAYDPGRVLETSATLLGRDAPEHSMAEILFERPHSPPEFLEFEYARQSNPAFKIFKVDDTP